LHRRVGEVLRDQFTATAAAEPELVAHHFTQAGLMETAIEWWGKAGQRSLERSALVEAAEQFKRALDQIATLPATLSLRRDQINLQVALANALMHTKGYATPETKAALGEARSLIEKAEALGDLPEDPLLLFSILYGFWVVNFVAFNGDAVRDLSEQFLALAEKQTAAGPLLVARRLMGSSLSTMPAISRAVSLVRVHQGALCHLDPNDRKPASGGRARRLPALSHTASVITNEPPAGSVGVIWAQAGASAAFGGAVIAAMAIAAAENAVRNHPVIFFELIKSGTSLQRRGGRTLARAGPPAFRGGRFGGIRTPS
jgi:hypothetical protein